MECYECGEVAKVTRTEGSVAEHDLVCAACADYELAAGYPVFPLTKRRNTVTYTFTVTVECETQEQATQVIAERLNHDEDYGFPYEIRWDEART